MSLTIWSQHRYMAFAIPKMLPPDPAVRAQMLEAIRSTVHAIGKPSGERAERLAQIEKFFADATPVKPVKAATPVKSVEATKPVKAVKRAKQDSGKPAKPASTPRKK